jgi:hypothetical protein
MSSQDKAAFRLRPTLLMRLALLIASDELKIIFRDQDLLRDGGRVVWGFTVQANSELFEPSNRTPLPAAVLYSPDPAFDERPDVLQSVAEGLFDLKGTTPDNPELAQFAAAITDEYARTMRLQLPPVLCAGRAAYMTSCIIQPSHLPGGYLAAPFYPLVIFPERTVATMMLPCQYWPAELLQAWSNGMGY